MSFFEVSNNYSWGTIKQRIYSSGPDEVMRALAKSGKRDLNDFAALLSPAAKDFLPSMLELSSKLTRKRFGKTMQLYIPMYLSNECQNICTYCGFSYANRISRVTLGASEILSEIQAIKPHGYEHVLIVTGEATKIVGMDYFEKMLPVIKPHFSYISMEVQPLDEDDYRKLIALGVSAVLVYQETYNREAYARHHLKGRKSNFVYRIETPDRLGAVGIHKIGLGVLLGLEDWRVDSWFVGAHLMYLERKYWKTKYSISFPRLRPAVGLEAPVSVMADEELLQLIAAYRIFNEDIELSLSTRESAAFRDSAILSGITSISAGSSTEPGGYSVKKQALKQFEISDERTPAAVADAIRLAGFEPVWKDWDSAFMG